MTVKELVERHPVGRWFTNFMLILVLFAVAFVVDTRAGQRDTRSADRDYRQRLAFCMDLEGVRTYARDAANRALETLPTLAYYKEHPEELAAARANLYRQRRAFSPPRNCEAFADSLR